MMEIKRKCVMCGTTKTIVVSEAGYNKWVSGALIQDALPELSADDREMLMSDICPSCYDRLFLEVE